MSNRTHELGPKFKALADTLRLIAAMVEKANAAENFQTRSALVAKNLSTGFDRYGNREVSDDLLPVCKDINARIAAAVTAEFEARRDQEIERLAASIESIRTTLPDLAAKACVEVGTLCRDMRAPVRGADLSPAIAPE